MTSDQFHTKASDGQAKPGPRRATLIKACCCCPKSQKKRKKKRGRLNYANLQDKYILILLEYKLIPQPSDQTLCYKCIRIQEYKIILCLKGLTYLASEHCLRKTTVEESSSYLCHNPFQTVNSESICPKVIDGKRLWYKFCHLL